MRDTLKVEDVEYADLSKRDFTWEVLFFPKHLKCIKVINIFMMGNSV